MEQKILVIGKGISQEIIGETLVDAVGVAYRRYRGQRVALVALEPLGHIEGQDLVLDPDRFSHQTVREIIDSLHE